jgi:hypothetical protein
MWKARLAQAELTRDASKTNVGSITKFAKAKASMVAEEA